MATFEAQVHGLTGLGATLSGSTNPTDGQLDQFLHDGVVDVTNRCLAIRPQDFSKFSRRSGETTSQGYDPGGAKIISVIREAGTDNDWRQCREVSTSLQSRVTDSTSLHYASKYNPAYFVSENGEISVFPSPDSSNDTWKAYYLNVVPIEESPDDGNTLDGSSSGVKYFPDHLEYLIPLYASIKSLEAKLGEYSISEEDTELVQSLAPLLASYKDQYDRVFMFHAPKQEKK